MEDELDYRVGKIVLNLRLMEDNFNPLDIANKNERDDA